MGSGLPIGGLGVVDGWFRSRLARTLLSVVLLAVAVGGVNYADLAGSGAVAAADHECYPGGPGAYEVPIYDSGDTIIGSVWMCPASVDLGSSTSFEAGLAVDGSGRFVAAINDSGTDELVVARFLSDGTVDTSWGSGGVTRIPHSTDASASPWHQQLDVVAGGDGSAYVWTGNIAYRFTPSGTAGWQTPVPRCDAAGLPTLSLSPDDSVLWTGGFDDGGCTSGYVGQIDTATGDVIAQGWLDPYVFTIRAIDTTSAWAFDVPQAAVISIGDSAGDQWQPTLHDINIDATVTYPHRLDYMSFRSFPAASYVGGEMLVAGPVDPFPADTPTQVSVMLLDDSGMDTSFGGDGAVLIDTDMRVVGVGSNSNGVIFVALTDEVVTELRAYQPDGSPDTGFHQDGVFEISNPTDEMIVTSDVAAMTWAEDSTLFLSTFDVSSVLTGTTFVDVPATHTFYSDIEWLADQGITRGCNPPDNDMFCPTASVTRGQMAAFLHRALSGAIAPVGEATDFTDDDASAFEADIEWLSASGITAGCNPPTNDQFCPNDPVTRGQMAAFLVRALGYSDNGGGDLFSDDDGSIFENQIDKLATAGVTRGCNPPLNDHFCPNSNVTRAQMAAFLHRALGD